MKRGSEMGKLILLSLMLPIVIFTYIFVILLSIFYEIITGQKLKHFR